MVTSRRRAATVTAAACLLLTPAVHAVSAAEPPTSPPPAPVDGRGVYTVPDTDVRDRTEIVRSGALVLSTQDGTATVEATPAQARELREAGIELRRRSSVADALEKLAPSAAAQPGFPPEDQGYHTYEEMVAELGRTAADHPGTTTVSSVGTSAQGRDIPVLKISDNAGTDENEPEVLFTCNQHAREHLTAEMCLHIAQRYTDNYGKDAAVTDMVDSREIWVIPMVNPDGVVHDLAGDRYRAWRRNREATPVDLNRNWGYKWGCCGGSSGNPDDPTYRGDAPFSAPETSVVRDFVNSRVVGGTQQIAGHIDFHTFSELVLWPYGYTTDNTAPGMTRQEYDRFARIGRAMAETNGYAPQQSSDLYVTDGSVNDWMWNEHDILSFTFEMYPGGGGVDSFYPPDEVIERETTRNDEAVAILLRESGA